MVIASGTVDLTKAQAELASSSQPPRTFVEADVEKRIRDGVRRGRRVAREMPSQKTISKEALSGIKFSRVSVYGRIFPLWLFLYKTIRG